MEFQERRAGRGRRDGSRLVGVHARLNAVLCDLFDLMVELDTDEALLANAMTDAVSWLRFDLGIAPRTARAWVRAARALTGLPVIAAAFRAGSISLDELLILSRFASSDNEAELLALTRRVPVDELAAAVRVALDGDGPADRSGRDRHAALRMWWDDTSLQLRGSIPGADGVLVETALLRLAAKAPLDPASGLFRDPERRYGEALVQMASESAAEDRDHDRATVVVHIGIDALADPDATVSVGGRVMTRDEVLRLTCDGRLQPALDDPDGVTIGIGRVSRQIPGWLRRTLVERDRGCRFPGCRRTRWTHGHHIVHWADGGPTNLDNLVTLCGFHHRLIHNQGWTLSGNPNRGVTFINQWGRPHVAARNRIPVHHQDRLVADLDIYRRYRLDRLPAVAHGPP